MHTFRVLLVVTSADRMNGSPEPTGVWLEELAAPYYAFLDTRCQVTIASPKGGAAPIDPTSLKAENLAAAARRFEADRKARKALDETVALNTLDPHGFDAVFFPGGHGTMEDLPGDPAVREMVEAFYAAGKPLAAVCHGPACLVNAKKPDGVPLIAGHHFTCFTDEEETIVGLRDRVPFLLESKLSGQGGIVQAAPAFTANAVVDHHLITGQNPASSIPAAEAVISHMRRHISHRRAA